MSNQDSWVDEWTNNAWATRQSIDCGEETFMIDGKEQVCKVIAIGDGAPSKEQVLEAVRKLMAKQGGNSHE